MEDTANTKISYIFIPSVWLAQIRGADIKTAGIAPRRPIIYRKLNNFWKVIAAGAMISLCIEIIQLPFRVRASDVDDLILNVLGVAIGYGIYATVKGLKR